MATIKPATKHRAATIELTREEKERIERISPNVFFEGDKLPGGVRLITSSDEASDDEASNSAEGKALETP
jgi:hypothetical protein